MRDPSQELAGPWASGALAAHILSPRGRLLQGWLIDLDGGQTKTDIGNLRQRP